MHYTSLYGQMMFSMNKYWNSMFKASFYSQKLKLTICPMNGLTDNATTQVFNIH